MDSSQPGSSVHGIFQARILEWVAISFSRGSSRPRDWTRVSCIVGRCFTLWATRKVLLAKSLLSKGHVQWMNVLIMIKAVHHGLHTNHISCFIRGVPFGIYGIRTIRQSPFSDFSVTFIQLSQADCSIGNNLLWVWICSIGNNLLWVWIREVWSWSKNDAVTKLLSHDLKRLT